MVEPVKKLAMAGVPLFSVVFLCGACFYAGAELYGAKPTGKYVVAERSAAILEAVMGADNAVQAELERAISIPVLKVVKKYSDAGYVVIDADRDENGFMVIAGVPPGTKDVTNEMRAAIAEARKASTKGANHAPRS